MGQSVERCGNTRYFSASLKALLIQVTRRRPAHDVRHRRLDDDDPTSPPDGHDGRASQRRLCRAAPDLLPSAGRTPRALNPVAHSNDAPPLAARPRPDAPDRAEHRKYKNPVHALRTILQEEGGLWTTYFNSNLFIPALLEGIVRPLLHLSTPLIISRYLRLEPSTSPVWFGLAELVLGTAGLLLTIPLETVRKRLQLQSRAAVEPAGSVARGALASRRDRSRMLESSRPCIGS